MDYSTEGTKQAALETLKRIMLEIMEWDEVSETGMQIIFAVQLHGSTDFQYTNGKIGCTCFKETERYCGTFEDFVNDPKHDVSINAPINQENQDQMTKSSSKDMYEKNVRKVMFSLWSKFFRGSLITRKEQPDDPRPEHESGRNIPWPKIEENGYIIQNFPPDVPMVPPNGKWKKDELEAFSDVSMFWNLWKHLLNRL